MRLNPVVHTKPRDYPEKSTLTPVGKQQLPDNEETHSIEGSCGLRCTLYNSRKVCEHHQTDTDLFNAVLRRNRNIFYLKVLELEPKKTEYEAILLKRMCVLIKNDVTFQQCKVSYLETSSKMDVFFLVSFFRQY